MAASRLAVWEAVTSPWAVSSPSGRLKVATVWDWLSAQATRVTVDTRWEVPTLWPSRNRSRVRMLSSRWLRPVAPRSRVVDWMVTVASCRVLAPEAEAAREGRAMAATSATASRVAATARPVRARRRLRRGGAGRAWPAGARAAMVDTGNPPSFHDVLTQATVGGWAAWVVHPWLLEAPRRDGFRGGGVNRWGEATRPVGG